MEATLFDIEEWKSGWHVNVSDAQQIMQKTFGPFETYDDALNMVMTYINLKDFYHRLLAKESDRKVSFQNLDHLPRLVESENAAANPFI
ncbi:MAG: hypothetical protein ABW079_17150 [Sedimenticola sp.]